MFVSMAGVFGKSNKRFCIDDAFEEECTVNIYGSTNTTERSPLKPKSKFKNSNDLLIDIENSGSAENESSSSAKLSDGTMSSRDSDSFVHDDVSGRYAMFDRSQWWCYHPKVRENWRTVLAAVLLLIIGIGLIAMGFAFIFYPDPGLQGFVFIFTGLICFIPGSYHVVYIYFAVIGKSGYDFYHLPIFN